MHRFIPDSTEAPDRPVIDPSHTLAIKRWATAFLKLPGDAVVTVSEFPCADAGCPLVETTVAVFEPARTRRWHFTRSRVAITRLLVQQALASPPRLEAPAAT